MVLETNTLADNLVWLAWVQVVMMLIAIVLVARVLFRLKSVEERQAAELVRTSAMVDTVTGAAMKVTTQTSAIAERLALVTDRAANQAAEESAMRHKLLGADLAEVLRATHEMAEQLTKKIERPVLAETIQEATHDLGEKLSEKIDEGTAKAEQSYHEANSANQKIAALTELVSKQQKQNDETTAAPTKQLDEIQTVVEDTHEIVKEIPPVLSPRSKRRV